MFTDWLIKVNWHESLKYTLREREQASFFSRPGPVPGRGLPLPGNPRNTKDARTFPPLFCKYTHRYSLFPFPTWERQGGRERPTPRPRVSNQRITRIYLTLLLSPFNPSSPHTYSTTIPQKQSELYPAIEGPHTTLHRRLCVKLVSTLHVN